MEVDFPINQSLPFDPSDSLVDGEILFKVGDLTMIAGHKVVCKKPITVLMAKTMSAEELLKAVQ